MNAAVDAIIASAVVAVAVPILAFLAYRWLNLGVVVGNFMGMPSGFKWLFVWLVIITVLSLIGVIFSSVLLNYYTTV